MSTSFPGESAEYRAARDRLLEQEVELRRVTEAVAAARRALPPGGVAPENYVFEGQGPGGAPTEVTLSDLFEPGKDTLFIYNMMFPRAADEDLPCPSCTQFLDSFDGVAEHAGQRINVAVVVKTALPRILAHAESRGWRRLRLLSSAGNTYNRDYHGETDDGSQQLPMLNVFRREATRSDTSGVRNSCSRRRSPVKIPGTARRSTRCGTCSTSRPKGAGAIGTPTSVTRDEP